MQEPRYETTSKCPNGHRTILGGTPEVCYATCIGEAHDDDAR